MSREREKPDLKDKNTWISGQALGYLAQKHGITEQSPNYQLFVDRYRLFVETQVADARVTEYLPVLFENESSLEKSEE